MNHLSRKIMGQGRGNGRESVFTCERHGEYAGKVYILGGKEREPICPQCFREQAAAENREIYEKRMQGSQKSLIELFGHAGIPPRFLKSAFSNYHVEHEGQAHALSTARDYAIRFKEMREQGKGLVFSGTSGTGKTHLATAICRAVIRDGYSALFTSTLRAVQLVTETYRRNSEMSEREAMAQLVVPDLLVLDEVGVQHNSSAEHVVITDLINQRYELLKPVILLTNLTPMELPECLDARVMRRLRETTTMIICKWDVYGDRHR